MKNVVKAALILMAILTAIYASVVVYAYAHYNLIHDVVYAAYEYEIPPTDWYTPEELGIVKIIELGENADCLQIVVDREKEPFPFGPHGPTDQRTIFLYKDRFYTVATRWVTFVPKIINQWQIPIGGALGTGWLFSGVLFLKWRKKE